MGHHSIQITVDLYAHLAPEGNKGAVDKLDEVDFDKVGATIRNLSATECSHEKKRLENQPLVDCGAGNGIRTRDFNLGKVALYL